MNSPEELDSKKAGLAWAAKKIFLCTLVAASIGLIYGLVLGFRLGAEAFGPGLLFTATFGGFVGLGASILFLSLRKLRMLATGSRLKMAAAFAVLAMLPGALMFSMFSEGLAMALYQAVYGAIVGGLIGAILGFLMGSLASK